jgi:hypothetical protein
MGHGVVKSKLIDSFKQRIADLENKAREQSDYFRRHGTTRPWHTPDAMADRDLLDVPALHEPAWNRDDANRIYAQDVLAATAENKAGTQGDIIALKRQIDFMAAEERAWRARHASFARCAAHAHGRLDGHGAPNAGVFSRVQTAADNARLRGQSSRRVDPSLSAEYVA